MTVPLDPESPLRRWYAPERFSSPCERTRTPVFSETNIYFFDPKSPYLGKGVYGVVRKVQDVAGRVWAMKVNVGEGERGFDSLLNEARILKDLKDHPFTVSMAEVFDTDSLSQFAEGSKVHKALILSLSPAIDLYKMWQMKETPFSLSEIRTFAEQLIGTVAAYREKGIFHLDLKPANLSFCPELQELRVFDFGLSCYQSEVESRIYQSLRYRSPECLCSMLPNKDSDLWSVGCILFEIYGRKSLFFYSSKKPWDCFLFMVQRIGMPSRNFLRKISPNNTEGYERRLILASKKPQCRHWRDSIERSRKDRSDPKKGFFSALCSVIGGFLCYEHRMSPEEALRILRSCEI